MKPTLPLLCGLLFGLTSVNAHNISNKSDFSNANRIENPKAEKKLLTRQERMESLYLKTQPMNSFPDQEEREKSLAKTAAKSSSFVPDGQITNVYEWGTLDFADVEKTLTFSLFLEVAKLNGITEYYKSAEFKFYNDSFQVKHTVKLELPSNTNRVEIYPIVTERYFDNSGNDFEFILHIHHFEGEINPENQVDEIWVVRNDGTILQKYKGYYGIYLFYETEPWFKKGPFVLVSAPYTGDSLEKYKNDSCQLDIMNTSMSSLSDTLFSLKFPWELLSYYEGEIVHYKNIEGVPYMIVNHYDKAYIFPDDQEGEIDPNKENALLMQFYKRSTELNSPYYKVEKEIKLPLLGLDENPYGFISFGYFGGTTKWDITVNKFNNSGKINILYAMSRYFLDCDCNKVQYYLMDEDGTALKQTIEDISYVARMAPLVGFEDQYALCLGGSSIESFRFMNLPSWTYEEASFDAVHNGDLLSTNFNRAWVDTNYQYVFFLGQGSVDEDTNVYASVVWYNRSAKEVQRFSFNTGNMTALAEVIINEQTLNPYAFETDGEREYVVFTKVFNPDFVGTNTYLTIYKESGAEVVKWGGMDPEYGSFSGAGFYSAIKGEITHIYGSYQDDNYNISSLFYKLPFDRFSGGDGSIESPYLIATPGDLHQVRYYLSSHFRIINDIDLSNFPSLDGLGWLPIANLNTSFTGSLDGGNFRISNMYNRRPNAASNGLFAFTGVPMSEDSVVLKNIILENIDISGGTITAGGLVGDAAFTYVLDCDIQGSISNSNALGGIIGTMHSGSFATRAQFEGTLSNANIVGGIVGDIKTGSQIMWCRTSGDILNIGKEGNGSAGGILGSFGSDPKAYDCYSNMNVKGNGSLGGVIGSVQANSPKRMYSTGNVMAGNPEILSFAGGLIGQSSYSIGSGYESKYMIALNDTVIGVSGANEIDDRFRYLEVGRVIGLDRNFFDSHPTTPYKVDSNYALASMWIGKADSLYTVNSSNIKSPDGKNITKAELTKTFFESLTWDFSTDSKEHWVYQEGAYPRFWYEFLAKSIRLNQTKLQLDLDEEYSLLATVYPADALNKSVNWTSSDSRIATVDNTGKVKALATGACTITATSVEGGYTASCEITAGYPVSAVRLNRRSIQLSVSDTFTLMASVLPENASNKKVSWSSNASTIAEVSENGLITAKSVGSSIVSVKTEEGSFTDTCLVKVLPVSIEEGLSSSWSIYAQHDQLIVSGTENAKRISIYSTTGRMVEDIRPTSSIHSFSTLRWGKGIYVIHISDKNGKSFIRKVSVL